VRAGLLALGGGTLGLAFGALLATLVATRVFGFEVLTVQSGSMAPAIEAGDLVVVRPTSIDDVSEGDVVLFAAGGDGVPTVHRVAGINELELRVHNRATGTVDVLTEHRLVTKGDANSAPDQGEIGREDLLGEVWFTVPRAGTVLALPMQYFLFGLAGAVLAAWAAWELVMARRRTQ